MPIVFAAATSHAPGITAWTEAAEPQQKDRLYAALEQLRRGLEAARVEKLILLTSEHWVNFFLDHIGAFCVGRGSEFTGPVEPWLRVERTRVPGDPPLAQAIIDACYDNGFEPAFSEEMVLDHGTMVPLHFLTPLMRTPCVPIMFNTLAAPQPSASRCYDLGRVIGRVAAALPDRIGIVATGGMSHDPGERNHGIIDEAFDRRFLEVMERGDEGALRAYTREQFAAAGAGAFELLAWIALRGALAEAPGTTLAYEAVHPWATGSGVMAFEPAV